MTSIPHRHQERRCVRLTQGRADRETIYAENPADVAKQFKADGSAWCTWSISTGIRGRTADLAAVQAIAALG